MQTTLRPRVFLDVTIDGEPAGRLVIELFTAETPRTCENFRQLCSGEHNEMSYSAVPFHRIIDEFMIQGGDIANGDGTGTASIYGGEFDDENLEWRDLDAAGLVCCANRGRNTNGSQFFITLEACPHLNGKHTVFGRLVGSNEALKKIASVAVDKNDSPLQTVLISRCGELERKQKRQNCPTSREHASKPSSSKDRGRRRKSDHSEDEDQGKHAILHDRTGSHTKVPISRRDRRQSDGIVDEGIRGRPRMRSGSRSRSPHHGSYAASDENEDAIIDEAISDSDSQRDRIHKRKRSKSPSRHVGSEQTRRRRSLPNQYDHRSHQGRGHHRDTYRDSSTNRGDQKRSRQGSRQDHESHHHHDRRSAAQDRRGEDDNYRPIYHRTARDGRQDDHAARHGRLGGFSEPDAAAPAIKFKGRGIMKYREPNRAW